MDKHLKTPLLPRSQTLEIPLKLEVNDEAIPLFNER